ncbi:SirB2 family protein [Aquincola sp. S2]|uniref:SirB2 family protein n=1 Tax=Pseudaquabacterium terrae TaxID=2732868 RepID=A0ABX2EQS8_9BURK|nr:SirB2 family protein [Aquabacterium terrae]NRF71030.1 SirB2 family protein [Aquabacterium terrae]
MDYATLKTIHQLAVVISLVGFFARGAGALLGAEWATSRAAKTLPHIVDTVLLLSALALAWMLKLTPGNAPWITAKIIGLIAYIGLGVVALRPSFTKPVRAAAWLAALMTAAWIVSVAVTKHPAGLLSL